MTLDDYLSGILILPIFRVVCNSEDQIYGNIFSLIRLVPGIIIREYTSDSVKY